MCEMYSSLLFSRMREQSLLFSTFPIQKYSLSPKTFYRLVLLYILAILQSARHLRLVNNTKTMSLVNDREVVRLKRKQSLIAEAARVKKAQHKEKKKLRVLLETGGSEVELARRANKIRSLAQLEEQWKKKAAAIKTIDTSAQIGQWMEELSDGEEHQAGGQGQAVQQAGEQGQADQLAGGQGQAEEQAGGQAQAELQAGGQAQAEHQEMPHQEQLGQFQEL
jgi:hypothetical protein